MGTKTKIATLIADKVDENSTLEELAYAAAGVKHLSENETVEEDAYQIGTPGEIGFGVAAVRDEYLPGGWRKMEGHSDMLSDNYGNVVDASGSIMVWVPKFYFKITLNDISISHTPKSGYVIHRAFINAGKEQQGVFVDKYGCGNVGGIFASKKGIDPCSTHADHNPINNLSNAPGNDYGGLYAACKTRSNSHFLTSDFIYSAIAMLAYAHGQAATSVNTCAYADVLPYMPKGNLNNALADVNDSSVVFSPSGYSNCALTGSGEPFAKTTHNGQNNGIADLNGNMWEVASGFIRTDINGFLVLKESVDISAIADDSTTQSAGGSYDIDLYDVIDLSDIISGDDGWIYLGNGSNQVFAMSTDRSSAEYKRTALGIPISTAVSASGTTQFGNDGLKRYLRDEMACLRGGSWGNPSRGGPFCATVDEYRTYSSQATGGRASVYPK